MRPSRGEPGGGSSTSPGYVQLGTFEAKIASFGITTTRPRASTAPSRSRPGRPIATGFAQPWTYGHVVDVAPSHVAIGSRSAARRAPRRRADRRAAGCSRSLIASPEIELAEEVVALVVDGTMKRGSFLHLDLPESPPLPKLGYSQHLDLLDAVCARGPPIRAEIGHRTMRLAGSGATWVGVVALGGASPFEPPAAWELVGRSCPCSRRGGPNDQTEAKPSGSGRPDVAPRGDGPPRRPAPRAELSARLGGAGVVDRMILEVIPAFGSPAEPLAESFEWARSRRPPRWTRQRQARSRIGCLPQCPRISDHRPRQVECTTRAPRTPSLHLRIHLRSFFSSCSRNTPSLVILPSACRSAEHGPRRVFDRQRGAVGAQADHPARRGRNNLPPNCAPTPSCCARVDLRLHRVPEAWPASTNPGERVQGSASRRLHGALRVCSACAPIRRRGGRAAGRGASLRIFSLQEASRRIPGQRRDGPLVPW